METSVLLSLAALAGGLCGWLVKSLFKGPRELQGDAERRIATLETLYTALSLKVEGTYARHDEALENLTSAVERLTERFERFMERAVNGHPAGGR